MRLPNQHTTPPIIAKLALAGLCLSGAPLACPALDTPSPVDSSLLTTEPYRDTGLLYTSSNSMYYMGSGYLVNNRAVVTAAHVIFDESTLSWRTGTYFDQAYNNYYAYARGIQTAGSMHLNSFSTALQEFMESAEYSEGMEDGPTFNSDIAVMYAIHDFSGTYGAYTISFDGEPSLACEGKQALLLGYPMSSTYIESANMGLMHQTGPGNWDLEDSYGNNTGNAYAGQVHAALYVCYDQMQSYSGNSGGPLFLYDEDEGGYVDVGEVLGGGTSSTNTPFMYFRIIDENAQNLIEQAIATSGATTDLSAPTLSTTSDKGKVTLSWTNSAIGEDGWQIRRNNGKAWEIIGTTDASATTYADETAENGITYQYEVRAISKYLAATNKGPWSKRAAGVVYGAATNTALAKALGASYLCVTSSGDAPYFAASDNSYVQSGKIGNNQNSVLTITVTGPGTLNYQLATSTEGAAYDRVNVVLDSSTLTHVGGENSYASRQITVSGSGSHTITFTYSKDNYGTVGEDCVRLKNLSYYCTDTTEAVQGGKITSGDWHYSPWLGHYYDYGNHWVYSFNMGYLYIFPTAKADWANDPSQWVYFDQTGSNYDKIGWCWIGAEIYPDMWSVDLGWLYYYENSNWLEEYTSTGNNGGFIKL